MKVARPDVRVHPTINMIHRAAHLVLVEISVLLLLVDILLDDLAEPIIQQLPLPVGDLGGMDHRCWPTRSGSIVPSRQRKRDLKLESSITALSFLGHAMLCVCIRNESRLFLSCSFVTRANDIARYSQVMEPAAIPSPVCDWRNWHLQIRIGSTAHMAHPYG